MDQAEAQAPNDTAPIPGFPMYRAGKDGAIWSCYVNSRTFNSQSCGRWRKIQGGIDRDGYRKVILCVNGTRRYLRRHAVILLAFVGPCPSGQVGCHLNGDREDNRVSNLTWATQAENISHKVIHGTMARGERHGHAKLTAQEVREMRRLRESEHLSLLDIAKQFKINKSHAYAILSYRAWKSVEPCHE